MRHINTGVNSDTQDNRLGAKAILKNKKKARKRFSITQFLRAGVMASSIFVLLASSFFFPATLAHAEDTGSVTYEHNLLTIKGPKISRDTILAAIANIPDTDYFGVLIDGDVEIINCLEGKTGEGSFLTKRDHITSFQALGTTKLLTNSDDFWTSLNSGNLLYNLGNAAHPIKQLDVRSFYSSNFSNWNNLFVNDTYGINSFNWCGITPDVNPPSDWDWQSQRYNFASAFSKNEPYLYHQIIMTPTSPGRINGFKFCEMLDVIYWDAFSNARLFVNGIEDTTWTMESQQMFAMMVTYAGVDPADNTVYNFVIPNADVSVGFYAAGGAWEGNDGTYEYMQQQTEKSLQGIKPTIPEAPTREGYTFVGWTSDPRSGTPDVTQETIPEFGVCNCAYYAVWQKDEPTPPTPPSPEPTPEPIPASDGELIPSTGDRAL